MFKLLLFVSLLSCAVSSLPSPSSSLAHPLNLISSRGGAQLSDDDDSDVSSHDFSSDSDSESDADESSQDDSPSQDESENNNNISSPTTTSRTLPRSPIQFNPNYDPSTPTHHSSFVSPVKATLSKIPRRYLPLLLIPLLFPSRFTLLPRPSSTTLVNLLWILLLLKRHFGVDIFEFLGGEARLFFPVQHKDKQNVRHNVTAALPTPPLFLTSPPLRLASLVAHHSLLVAVHF